MKTLESHEKEIVSKFDMSNLQFDTTLKMFCQLSSLCQARKQKLGLRSGGCFYAAQAEEVQDTWLTGDLWRRRNVLNHTVI